MLQKATVFCILLLLIVLYGCNENKDLNKISTQEQLVKIIEREIYQRELEDAEENIAILEQQDAKVIGGLLRASINCEKNDFKKCIAAQDSFEKLYFHIEKDEYYFKYLYEQGEMYLDYQEDTLAIEYFEKLKSFVVQHTESKYLCLSNLNIGKCYLNMKKDSIANSYIQEGFTQSMKSKDSLVVAFGYAIKSQYSNRMGAFDSVLYYATKSIVIYERLGHIKGILINHLLIGTAYFLVGMPDKSDQYFKSGIDLAIEKKEEFILMKLYVNYGNLLTYLKKSLEAKTAFVKAYQLNRKLMPDKVQTQILIALGNLAKDNQDLVNALEYYKSTADQSLLQKNYENYCKALQGVGNVYFESGDHKKALFYYKRIEEMLPNVKSEYGRAQIGVHLGVNYNLLNRIDESIKFCKRTVDFGMAGSLDDLVSQGCDCLVKNYKKLNNIDSLEYYIKKRLEIKEAFYKNSAEIEMSKKTSKIEYEKDLLAKEVSIISLQNQLEIKNKKRALQNLFTFFLSLFCITLFFLADKFHKQKLKLSRINEKYKAKQLQLDEKNQNLKSINSSLKNFAFIAANDIKGPLNTNMMKIKSMEKQLAEKVQDVESWSHFLDEIRTNNLQLNKMIDDLLELSNIDVNLPDKTVFDLHEIVIDVIHDVNTLKLRNFIAMVDKLPTIYAHESLIRVLFQNIIVFMIQNCCSQNELLLEIKSEIDIDKKLHLSISDNCQGLKKHLTQSLFNAFEGQDNLYESNGIGLATCKKIVELYEGKIWVLEDSEQGNKFFFTINVIEDNIL